MTPFNRVLTALPILFIVLSFAPAAAVAATAREKGVVMGTDLEVVVSGPDVTDRDAGRAFAIARAEFERLEPLMSEWIEGSPVSRINREAGKGAVEAPPELFKVVAASLKVSELTGGAFDVTWAALRGLWRFKQGEERVPSSEEVKKATALIGYRDVELNDAKKTVRLKRAGMAMGLGGIAKGYAVDKAMEALAKAGISNAVIKAGGDMRVQGLEDAAPWEVAIRDPRDKKRVFAKLRLTNISISTSGDYERFFVRDGKVYHHIIDPRTGYPADKARSVTIIAPDTMTSDALSTAVFVLGPVEGMALVKKLKGVEAIIVDAEGKVTASPGVESGE